MILLVVGAPDKRPVHYEIATDAEKLSIRGKANNVTPACWINFRILKDITPHFPIIPFSVVIFQFINSPLK
jgi:hypothetical protein